ncbi:hypothetical protein TWF481_008686 [Arthrobotrys musiformis]|uniref:HNH nuclease domain-containing protein n=1 Tax=Arthrobotrys musiformis TaxID=47236 RepID=A0AAV9WDN0_9PEZI
MSSSRQPEYDSDEDMDRPDSDEEDEEEYYDEDEDEYDDDDSSDKGSFASSSSSSSGSDFSDTTKSQIDEWYQNTCWVCERPCTVGLVDMVHVFPGTDTEFKIMHQRGIIPFTDGQDITNAIPLCKSCHVPFREMFPHFIILPADLRYFLDFEINDFKDRTELLKRGVQKVRTVPTGDVYRAHLERINSPHLEKVGDRTPPGGVYDVYIRYDHLPPGKGRERVGYWKSKIWHGSPTAMILHAARVNGTPGPMNGWLEMEKRDMMFEFVSLWSREPGVGRDALSVDEGGDKTPTALSVDAGPSGQLQEEVSNQLKREAGDNQPKAEAGGSQPKEAEASTDKERWQWGPQVTSGQVVDLYTQAE